MLVSLGRIHGIPNASVGCTPLNPGDNFLWNSRPCVLSIPVKPVNRNDVRVSEALELVRTVRVCGVFHAVSLELNLMLWLKGAGQGDLSPPACAGRPEGYGLRKLK